MIIVIGRGYTTLDQLGSDCLQFKKCLLIGTGNCNCSLVKAIGLCVDIIPSQLFLIGESWKCKTLNKYL